MELCWLNKLLLSLKRFFQTTDKSGYDATFGMYIKQDGKLSMGGKLVEIDGNGKIFKIDDKEYQLTPGLVALVSQDHHRPMQ